MAGIEVGSDDVEWGMGGDAIEAPVVTEPQSDPVATFYDRHPYPPPVLDLDGYAAAWRDPTRQRLEHHRLWPDEPYRPDRAILVAGCGTSQAARYAIRHPEASVVGIDVSEASVGHTRALARRHGLDNLELHRLRLEDAHALDRQFDHVVCTGVLHHLADPEAGLAALASVLAPKGAMQLMVYAPYGRTGIYMIQDYCRRLGIGTSPGDIEDLVASLRELPPGHPLSHLLRDTPDFQQDGALADALLHPRDRAYSVPELLALIRGTGLRFGRWLRQAPYLPDCGVLATIPHHRRLLALDPDDQYAAAELFRGTMTRHSAIVHRAGEHGNPHTRWLDGRTWGHAVPIPEPTMVVVGDRLPPGAAAAVLNRAHTFTDLVLFLDRDDKRMLDAIDGRRSAAEIGGDSRALVERLWRHDLVVIDSSATTGDIGSETVGEGER